MRCEIIKRALLVSLLAVSYLSLTSCMAVVGGTARAQPQVVAVNQESPAQTSVIDNELTPVEDPAQANEVNTDANDMLPPQPEPGFITFETSMGNITIALDAERAPKSVANILRYAHEGFYDGTVFHRVIDNFMVQGGGFEIDPHNKQFNQKETYEAIVNEGDNGLTNKRGSVAMARTSHPDSATAQFYINLVDNVHLNYKHGQAGYCVFGQVVEGMDVVDRMAKVETRRTWPVNPIIIKRAVLAPDSAAAQPVSDILGPEAPLAAEPVRAQITGNLGFVQSFTAGDPAVINVDFGSAQADVQKGDYVKIKRDGARICEARLVRVGNNKSIAEIALEDWENGVEHVLKSGDPVYP